MTGLQTRWFPVILSLLSLSSICLITTLLEALHSEAVCLQAVLHQWGSAHHWAKGASDPGGSLRNFRASQNDSSTETWRMEMQAGIHKAEERIHNYILLPINAKVTFDRTISCKPLRFPLHLVTLEFFY